MKPSFKLILTLLYTALSLAGYTQKATLDDKVFVAKVTQGGMFEVAAGRLGIIKGSTQDIRDFATAEVHDHTLVGTKLKKISAKSRIRVATALNVDFLSKLQHLNSLTETAFDKEYLTEMSTIHDMDGAAFAQEAAKGGTSAFDFSAETHRIVQRHIGAIRAVPAM